MRNPLEHIANPFRPVPRPRLVVLGMPKSGTTALAMLLGAASGLDVTSDPFHRLDERRVRFRDALYGGRLGLGTLVRGHRRIFAGEVLKDPNFIFFLPDLLHVFAGAAFVFIVRDPRDNVRSLLNRLDLPGRPEDAPRGWPGVNDAWRRVLEGRTPDVPCGDYVECVARRWRLAGRRFLSHRDRMQLVRYETFLADKVGTVERALRDAGIGGGRPIEHLVDRQYQPRGDRDVSWEAFFGPRHLRRIEEICAEEMRRFGYLPSETAST